MAKTSEIVVTLRLDDKGAVDRLGALEIETKQYQRELRALNAEIAKNGTATKEQTQQVGRLSASIRSNQTVIRELKNDLSGATAAGLRFRDKMAEASRAGLGAFGLQAASITTLTVGLINAVRELAKLSAEIEKVDARNAAIAGDSLPALTKAAEENANAIGLTRREYVSLAADQQLRLKNLGIEGALTEQLAIRTVETAEALSDFSGGQLDTNAAAKLLNDALTGQTRGLKELGINVKASKDEIDAIAVSLVETEGLTKEQATAVATLQLAFEATEKTMAVFKDQTLAIDEAQDAANAQLKEAKETLAESLTPAITVATQAGAGLLDVLSKIAQVQFGGAAGLGSVIEDVGRTLNEEFQKGIDQFVAKASDAQIKAQQKLVADRIKLLRKEGAGDFEAEAEVARLVDLYKQLQAGIDGTTVAVKAQGQAVEPQAKTLAQLREELKLLKEAREDLQITDTKRLAENAAQVAALGKQIAVIDGTSKAVKGLTAAQKAANKAAAEFAAFNPFQTGEDLGPLTQEQQAQADAPLFDPFALFGDGPQTQEAQAAITALTDAQQALRIAEIKGTADFNLQRLALDEQYFEAKTIGLEEYNAKVAALQDAERQQQLDNQNLAISAAGQFVGALSDIAEQGSAEYKALATAQALINTYLGATQALAQGVLVPPFVKIIQAAAIIASGLASVKQIQGFATGGVVQGGQPIQRDNGDNVLITAKRGEVILNETQQQRLVRLYGDDLFRRAGVPGFAGGGLVRSSGYTFTKSTGIIPSPSPRDLLAVESNAIARNTNFSPVVSVVEINRLQERVRVIEQLATG